jgi:tRNA(Glu) U13 pseudouridine synthase TruD
VGQVGQHWRYDWHADALAWNYAHDLPSCQGRIKAEPEHFRVWEEMPVVPQGAGEHFWLRIEKKR